MAKEKLRDEIVNRLTGEKHTLSEIAAAVKGPKKVIEDTIKILVSDGTIAEKDGCYFVSDELTETDWVVFGFVRSKGGRAKLDDYVAKQLGWEPVEANLQKLVAAGIFIKKGTWYRITAESAMKLPLSPDEREAFQVAEARITQLVGEIYPKQLEVAAELRKIRDEKLYRELHKRFEDYLNERFERTRDWAYKLIRDLEVAEGLLKSKAMPNVETLLQNVTARDMPHLAKLKKEPEKMKQAICKAEEIAKSESRVRTPDDIKKAVEGLKAPAKKPDEKTPETTSKSRMVEFDGIRYVGCITEDVPKLLTEFSNWLRKNPTDVAFTISVGKAM